MRFLFIFAVLFSAFAGTVNAKNVLVVTWQGKTRAEVGFEERLKKLRPEIKFLYLDAKRNKTHLSTLLRNYDLTDIDLVYSYGTTGTKIVKNILQGAKPHVFNIVSAPVHSGIANTIDKPGNNLTGAKLLIDLEAQLEVLYKLKKFKTFGIWFDPREAQSQAVVARIFDLLEPKGIKVKRFRFIPDAGKVYKNLDRLTAEANKMDALYVVATSSYTGVYPIMFKDLDPKLVVMGSVFRQVGFGATVALASKYEERGAATAELAHKILSGSSAGELPVNVLKAEDAYLYIDPHKEKMAGLKNVDALGIQIVRIDKPFELKKKR